MPLRKEGGIEIWMGKLSQGCDGHAVTRLTPAVLTRVPHEWERDVSARAYKEMAIM